MSDALPYEFVLYVDEAGDPGLKRVLPDDSNGSSEWLVLGGVLVRRKYELEVPNWVRSIRGSLGAHQAPELHFRKLNDQQKVQACELVATLPLRSFVVASNKRNMKGYINERAQRIPSQQFFYNWLIRILLERVSDCVWRQSLKDFQAPKKVRIIFSFRGGHAYSQTRAYIEYLKHQQKAGVTKLTKRMVRPQVLDIWQIEWEQSHSFAGGQLADVVASSFYAAASGSWSKPPFLAPARALAPVMATEQGCVDQYGLMLLPTPFQAELAFVQKAIFEHYGYVLSGR